MFRTLGRLRHPLAALGLCALLAQQVVGAVLTASPAMALESGFSLCLSGPPNAEDDPRDVVIGAGFCLCTLHLAAGLLPPDLTPEPHNHCVQTALPSPGTQAPVEEARHQNGLPRAPPALLHS